MAILDLETDAVVLRVVYDGPPSAGKTTSVETLAASLGRPLYTPQQRRGRTLYFDWMDWTGGRFEGHDVRCQVVSVPGQAILAPRRRVLLESADAVIFVCDSTAEAVAAARSYVEGLMQVLGRLPGPPVGVLVQANKRDLPGAVDLGQIRRAVGASAAGAAVVETVATAGTGVREAFDLAVRLGLDRARALLEDGTLPVGRPAIDSGPALFDHLRALQGSLPPAAAAERPGPRPEERAPAPPPVRRAARPPAAPPRLPEPDVPSGWIWPPVSGRIILHEVDALGLVPPRRLGNDDWAVTVGDLWRLRSPAEALFADADAGRHVLIEWARMHAVNLPLLSQPRGLVLAEAGPGSWRLWQVTKIVPSLRERLYEAARGGSPELLAAGVLDAARRLLEAAGRFRLATCRLRVNLDSVGCTDGETLYGGPLPLPAEGEPAAAGGGGDLALLRAELLPVVADLSLGCQEAVRQALAERIEPLDEARGVAGILAELLGEPAGVRSTAGRGPWPPVS